MVFPHIIVPITLATTLMLTGQSGALEPARWPDTPVSRLEALALMQSLNSDLLSNESATLTLDRWCEAHHLGEPAKIVAERVKGQDKPAGAEERKILGVGEQEVVKYRRVKLHCGSRVLSEADNWYLPGRLTDEMNRALDGSDIAFGRAVGALNFHRKTLEAQLLWNPLPPGWEMDRTLPPAGKGPLDIPPYLFQHHAVLDTPDGVPFSYVVETYTRSILDFEAPRG